MLKIKLTILLSLGIFLGATAQKIMPYYNYGQIEGNITSAKTSVQKAFEKEGYKEIGGYYVAGDKSMYVMVLTSGTLESTCLKVKERGVIAANIRVGFKQSGSNTELTMVNPKYMFLGYLRDSYKTHKSVLDKVSSDARGIMKSYNNTEKAFGGSVDEDDLPDYHYMAMMPYFDDPVELREFSSFEQAIATIEKNLNAKKGNAVLVYKQIFTSSKKAVYGVGLLDSKKGEDHFLSIIGKDHFAAMPYEIVVENDEVTILHGRFRFALYWPSLTMGTFTKIMSTPGDVEDFLEALTK